MADTSRSLHADNSSSRIRIPELLAPAGTMEAFKAAIGAGADAIYLGLDAFNARRNADNFTLETLQDACDIAHLAGSRVYVTTNVLIAQDEMSRATRLIHDAWIAGADAFIIQDWGLLTTIHELWPQIELHLSTQANVADPSGVRFAMDHGCTRVTLARELTLEEIRACCQVGPDIEVFGHGALCICYSGECLLSSMQRGRSANRGLCRQPCRLPYQLFDDDGNDEAHADGTRLLSPKDYCTLPDLEDLCRAGVASFKIEGRMKAPDYVATVVGVYRKAFDTLAARLKAAHPHIPALNSQEVDRDVIELRKAFNRDFTDAYLHGISTNDMMSYERGNNRGMLVGEVVSSRLKTARIRFDQAVEQGDLLEIRNRDVFDDYVTELAPFDIAVGSVEEIKLSRAMPPSSTVRLIRSEKAMRRARELSGLTYPRKRPIDVEIKARIGQPFEIDVRTHAHQDQTSVNSSAQGPIVEPARTRSISTEDLKEHVGRMGTSAFEALNWDIQLDNGVGMGFSTVHATRTSALDALDQKILEPWHSRAASITDAPYSLESLESSHGGYMTAPPSTTAELCAYVCTPTQAALALQYGATRIYAPADSLALTHDEWSRNDWTEGVIPVVGEVGRQADLNTAHITLTTSPVAGSGTVAGISLIASTGKSFEVWDTLELHNRASLGFFTGLGASGIWLSPELELMEISQIANYANPAILGITIFGHQRLMTTEHCVLQSIGPCAHQCASCKRRYQRHTLRDEFGRTYLVTTDMRSRSRLWDTTPLDATPQIPELLRSGIRRFLVDVRILDNEQTKQAVSHTNKALQKALAGQVPDQRLAGCNSGHLFSRIG